MRKGYTTGSCAQAAAKASVIMLFTQRPVKEIEIKIPSGVKLNLKTIDRKIGKGFARCAVVKDAGDDPDITDGAKIYAEVRFSKKSGIAIRGGKGVGRVTRPGLPVGVGEYAINPVPRQMILGELRPYLTRDIGLEAVISVPEGERLAEHTFNPRLGIVGGISIIGTTGIVEPKSTDAYKASLTLQLDVLAAEGAEEVVMVLGYVGEKFCKDVLKLKSHSLVKIGDHIGFMLRECVKKGIKKIVLVGYIGKLIKVAAGQFDTHIRFGDNRMETIASYARDSGAGDKLIKELLSQTTAQAAVDILRENGLSAVFARIASGVVGSINNFTSGQLSLRCILLSLNGEALATYPKTNE